MQAQPDEPGLLVCRCLTTQVVDEEEVYKTKNKQLADEVDKHRNALNAIREKVACFDDQANELAEARRLNDQVNQARSNLQLTIDNTN